MADKQSGILVYSPDENNRKTPVDKKKELAGKQKTLSSGKPNDMNVCNTSVGCVVTHPKTTKPKSNKQNKTKCDFTNVKIVKGGISKVITENGPTLKVVSGYNKNVKKIQCSIVGIQGPCPDHNNKTFDSLDGKQSSNTSLDFDIHSVPFYKIFDNEVVFPWNAKTSSYNVSVNCCDKKIQQKLEVYPDVKIELDIPLEFAASKETEKETTRSGKNMHVYTTPKEEYTIEAKYSEDGHEWKISPSVKEKFKKLKELRDITERSLKALRDALDESIKFEVLYPAGKIHLDFEWKEKKTPFEVGSEWHAQCSLDPLIGATLTLELDELALKLYSGPIGNVYSKIKAFLANRKIEIKFELVIKGTIKIDAGLKKEIDQGDGVKSGAGITGKIEADLKASAELKTQIIISIDATAQAGIKTGIEASGGLYSESEALDLELNFKFLGIKYYWSYQVSGGIKRKSKKTESEIPAEFKNNNETVWVEPSDHPLTISLG